MLRQYGVGWQIRIKVNIENLTLSPRKKILKRMSARTIENKPLDKRLSQNGQR